jgi:hypothetical protein
LDSQKSQSILLRVYAELIAVDVTEFVDDAVAKSHFRSKAFAAVVSIEEVVPATYIT